MVFDHKFNWDSAICWKVLLDKRFIIFAEITIETTKNLYISNYLAMKENKWKRLQNFVFFPAIRNSETETTSHLKKS